MAETTKRPTRETRLPVGPQLKEVLRIAYRARLPVLLEGHTGIGKSELLGQLADELGIQHVVLDLSLLEPPDLIGLPQIADGRTSYARPSILPTSGAGILVLEELNRAERYIQQPALQLLTARRLHEYELPEGWSACAAINPAKQNYQVTALDPALLSRFMRLVVCADRRAWLEWAVANGVHPAVTNVARMHDRVLEDVPPRTWTYVSRFLRVTNPEELRKPMLLRPALGGYLPPAWVEIVLEELKTWSSDPGVDVRQLFAEYHTNSDLQSAIRTYRDDGHTDRLEQITFRGVSLLEGPEFNVVVAQNQFSLEAFEMLLSDLPGDHAERLQDGFGKNLASVHLIGLTPDDVLRGYDGSPCVGKVDSWVKDRRKHHRVSALVTAISHHIRTVRDLNALRKNRNAMIGLGHFLSQIGVTHAEPLRETARQHSIEPTVHAAGKRRP